MTRTTDFTKSALQARETVQKAHYCNNQEIYKIADSYMISKNWKAYAGIMLPAFTNSVRKLAIKNGFIEFVNDFQIWDDVEQEIFVNILEFTKKYKNAEFKMKSCKEGEIYKTTIDSIDLNNEYCRKQLFYKISNFCWYAVKREILGMSMIDGKIVYRNEITIYSDNTSDGLLEEISKIEDTLQSYKGFEIYNSLETVLTRSQMRVLLELLEGNPKSGNQRNTIYRIREKMEIGEYSQKDVEYLYQYLVKLDNISNAIYKNAKTL